jgi:hypothetical protein
MVDKERRKKLALHLRHLSVGLITNDDFEESVMDDVSYGWLPDQYYRAKEIENNDPIIRPMLELCWCLYNDTDQYKLTGRHQLSEKELKEIARYILFLHSDLEYEWPYIDPTNPLFRLSFKEILLSVLTVGQYYRNKVEKRKNDLEESQALGDYEYWPFLKKEDYDSQLKKQPFLSGRNY